jgi:hypothetical protein
MRFFDKKKNFKNNVYRVLERELRPNLEVLVVLVDKL